MIQQAAAARSNQHLLLIHRIARDAVSPAPTPSPWRLTELCYACDSSSCQCTVTAADTPLALAAENLTCATGAAAGSARCQHSLPVLSQEEAVAARLAP